jgi:hypothetical protein
MPLIMQDRDGHACPVVVCDHCGERIEDARDGNYQWRMGLRDTDWGSRVFFTHKRCCHAFEQAHPEEGFTWGAIELECFPVYLGNNLRLDWEAARRTAAMLGSLE